MDKASVAAINGDGPPMLIVETPARHGKSLFLAQYLTSWYLCRNPTKQVIFVSATQRLAERWSRRCRGVIERYGKEYYGVELNPLKRSGADWELTTGGGMLAAGVGGDIVGRDGDLIVIDDYLRRSSDAMSEAIRDSQWDWFQSTLMTRLEPNGAVVLLATRWHTDDLIGRIVGNDDDHDANMIPYRRIKLPAIAMEADELGRKPGEALWPERWPLGTENEMAINSFGKRVIGLKMRQANMDPFWWDSIYQQHPRREGLGQWPAEYFDRLMVDSLPLADQAAIAAVDLAEGKTAKAGDFSAFCGLKFLDKKITTQAVLMRESPEVFIRRAVSLCVELRIFHLVVEAQQYSSLVGGSLETALREIPGGSRVHVELINNVVPKIQRIQRLGEYLARGQLAFVDDTGGRTLLQQLKDFPHGKHDDGPDALEMGIRFLPSAVKPQHRGQGTVVYT